MNKAGFDHYTIGIVKGVEIILGSLQIEACRFSKHAVSGDWKQ
jgi:hypothetical protein